MKKILFLITLAFFFVSCVGEDYTPVYFKPAKEKQKDKEETSKSKGGDCTISFRSQLCIVIKGSKYEAGTEQKGRICREVAAFPLRIEGGTKISIFGNEFPDIIVEGHGLPAPITINARGAGDGKTNIGSGTIDAAGNIRIEKFSFFLVALSIAAEVPNLILTTGETEKLEFLDPIKGSPPNVSGAMTLVTSTKIGHLNDAADKILLGASLAATFSGTITPNLSECKSSKAERPIKVEEYVIDGEGKEKTLPIPMNTEMLISSGTFISEEAADVGKNFESEKTFKVTNVSKNPISYQIPSTVGAFHLSAKNGMTGILKPNSWLILRVSFKPHQSVVKKHGEINETVIIGTDSFTLAGTALKRAGSVSVDSTDENGNVENKKVSDLEMNGVAMLANEKKEYFKCAEIQCNGEKFLTGCASCEDRTKGDCVLLSIGKDKKPLAERDKNCKLINPEAVPLYVLDIKGDDKTSVVNSKQVIAIRNTGVMDLEIKDIFIEDINNSKSKGEFKISKDEIFISGNFSSNTRKRAALPFKLKPYFKGIQEDSAFVTVTYHPKDLVGSDGSEAGVGSSITDKASLVILTSDGRKETNLTGKTSVREDPPLELYFKTSTGTKYVKNQASFPLSSLTMETSDAAFPLFLKPADSAKNTLRITGIKLAGSDAKSFNLLDTKEKIASLNASIKKGLKCTVPILDAQGNLQDEIKDPKPTEITPPGFDLPPLKYNKDTMPFFGCVNFHRDLTGTKIEKRSFSAELIVSAQEISSNGTPVKNSDGTPKEILYKITLIATIEPMKGKLVLRITQTMAAVLNPQFPSFSSIASYKDSEPIIKQGKLRESDTQVFTAAIILDPFDEETIKSADGKKILSLPNDGVTAIFRSISTHPSKSSFDNEFLFDYVAQTFDATRPEGQKGIFEDYPNVPPDGKANAWRIFTSSLSYPGPVALGDERPYAPSECKVIDPCDNEAMKQFSSAWVKPGEKGACAFFYASAGRYDSPAFHTKENMPTGERTHLCNNIGVPQNLIDLNTGRYTTDGHISIEEAGLRFFGPTFVHNPYGPVKAVPPLDVVLYNSFTTATLKPQSTPDEPNLIPDERINATKRNYLLNLNDTSFNKISPAICDKNKGNYIIGDKKYSSWKYLAPLLSADPEGKIEAGCPDEGNTFKGGLAYLHGRPLNHENGVLTFVTTANFGSDEDLTFAFKDTLLFIVLNGWLCDPSGKDDDFEGAKCFDIKFNERDKASQISITQ